MTSDHPPDFVNFLSLLDCPWIVFDSCGKIHLKDFRHITCESLFGLKCNDIFSFLRKSFPEQADGLIEAISSRADPSANLALRTRTGTFFVVSLKRINPDRFVAVFRPMAEIDYMDAIGRSGNWIDSRGAMSIFLVGHDQRIRSWNVSARSMFLFSKKEIINKPLKDLFDPAEELMVGQGMDFCLSCGWYEKDALLRRRDGSSFSARVVLARQRDTRYIAFAATDLSWINLVNGRIHELAGRDDLTGALNRRYFLDIVDKEILRVRRYGGNLSFIMLDADLFKKINDTYGHEAGDQVLRDLVKILNDTVRKVDVVARLGGEEFAILLPSTDLAGAVALAERLRRRIESYRVRQDEVEISFTASFGATTLTSDDQDTQDILRASDRALYRAKSAGRNRVEVELPVARKEDPGV